MDCRDFKKYLAAYIEGNLKDTLLQNMEKHRSSCVNCAREAKLHQFIVASLNETKPVKAPKGLSERILAAVENKAQDNLVDFTPSAAASTATYIHNAIPLDCRRFEDNIAAYVEGTLQGDLLRKMEEHRATCFSCERLVRVHKVVLASLNNAQPVKAPAVLAERILTIVAKAEKAVAYRKYRVFGSVLAAAGSLAAASIIFAGDIAHILSVFRGFSIGPSTIWLRFSALGLSLKAWAAANFLTPDHEIMIYIVNSVRYSSISLPLTLIYFTAGIVLLLYGWSYFRAPVAYNATKMSL